MQQDAFEAELKSGGYVEIETKAIEPRPVNTAHAHDYDIRGLVLDGIFIVAGQQARGLSRRRHLLRSRGYEPHRRDRPGGANILVGRKH